MQDATRRIRDAIRARYVLLPYIYTLFRHANVTGLPIMRPLWYEFPEVEATHGMDDEFLLGPALLVNSKFPILRDWRCNALLHALWSWWLPVPSQFVPLQVSPVLEAGAESRAVYLPGKGPWYSAKTGERVKPDASGALTVPVTMDSVPSFLRGGHIMPLRVRTGPQHNPRTLRPQGYFPCPWDILQENRIM